MFTATEILIDGFPTGSVKSYNTSSILLGNLINKYTDISGSNYFSPLEYQYIKPIIQSQPVADSVLSIGHINALKYNDNIDYVFMLDRMFNGFQRRIAFAAFDKSKNQWINQGSINFSASFTPTPQFTGFGSQVAAYLRTYTSGSVQVNGVGVTGSGTNWATNRIFQGSRIAFGTTSSLNVTNWYEIADVPTETNLRLLEPLVPIPSHSAGTPYLIEELKVIAPLGFTVGNFNGLLVINGLHAGTFANTRPLLYQYSSSADDRKQGYFLIRDALPSSSIYSGSLNAVAFEPNPISPSEHYAYMSFGNLGGGVAQFGYQKYNISRPVSASTFLSGAISESFVLRTGNYIDTGNTGLNMDLVTTNHGPGSGSLCIYHSFYARTGLRMFCIPIKTTTLNSGSTNYIQSYMLDVQAGGGVTRGTSGQSVTTYIPSLDKFLCTPTQVSTGVGARISLYKFTDGPLQDIRYGPYNTQVNNSPSSWISEKELPKHFIYNGDSFIFTAATDEMVYFMHQPAAVGTSSPLSVSQTLFGVPIACDWEAAPNTKQWVTFPPIETPNAISYTTVYTKSPKFIGGDAFGYAPEQLVIYYRTSGIDDDSGKWIRLTSSGDLKDVPVASKIQFSIAFDVLGSFGLYNRLYGICLTYDKEQPDEHYQASLEESNIANNEIVWVQVKKWNSNIPNLKINIYNNLNNSLLINDTTAVQNQGTFEYSEDGGITYQAWDNTKDAIGNRIKYTANSLPANTNVKIILNQS